MSKRTAFWIAWFTWVLYLVIAIVTLLLQLKNAPSELPGDIFGALVLLAFETVGALIASRRPQNPVGWIFCMGALLSILGTGLLEYTFYALITVPGSLPAGAFMGILGQWVRSMGWFLMLTFLLLLFPDGHLPSPRWQFLAWLIVFLLAVYSVTFLLSPYPYANSAIDPRLAAVRNPIGIGRANDLFDQLGGTTPLLLYPIIIACIGSVFLRFRLARGVERLQLKWFTYGMTLSILMLILIIILVFTTANGAPDSLFYLALVCIPISAGIAMLRYRLYDIDVLINRTLVYGLLSATLLTVYLLLVYGGQYLLASFFGPNNPVVLVASTLIVAALFQPLRRRVQQMVDRRFYRSKYNATQVVARFSETLRQEVNLDQLCSQLLTIVEETVQPTHISLWLRPPEHKGKQQVANPPGISGS